MTNRLQALNVYLVQPAVWKQALKEANLSPGLDLSPRESLISAVLNTFHDRHVGITPMQAAGLAEILQNPLLQSKASDPWAAGLHRLQKSFQTGENPRDDWLGAGLLLAADPVYTIFRLALPWIERAVAALQESWVFCAEDIDNAHTIDLRRYLDYSSRLTSKAVELAQREGGQLDLFWQDRANTLVNLSRNLGEVPLSVSAEASRKALQPVRGLPEPEQAALAFFYRLTDLPEELTQYKNLKRSHIPIQLLKTRHRREGGMAGLRVSHSLDEIDQMTSSELVNPPAILVDRILNTGFLTFEREPRRQRMRDVLVVAILPYDVTHQTQQGGRTSQAGDLLKACWFNCMTALGKILLLNRLQISEFRMIEGDAFGRMRASAYRLEWMTNQIDGQLNLLQAGSSTANLFRQKFLNNLRWMPALLDRRRAHQTVLSHGSHPSRADDRLSSLSKWIGSAWRSQKDLASWSGSNHQYAVGEPDKMADAHLALERYVYVHIMVFLPALLRNQSASQDGESGGRSQAPLANLTSVLGIGRIPGRNLSVTWAPARIEAASGRTTDSWAFSARGRSDVHVFLPGQSVEVCTVAERLEQLWIDQILREVQHG